jgi:hypothetical protein
MALNEKEKNKLLKAAGMVDVLNATHEKEHKKHEVKEDVVLGKIHKHVKHALAMHDLEGAMEALAAIDKLIKDMAKMQDDIEKHEKLAEATAPALTPAQVKWLKDMKITKYSVDSEGFVNVDGDVDISYKNLTSIPVKFGYVGEDFNCNNNDLSSLQGAPREVGGNFGCWNNKLTSLQGAPRKVGGNFGCWNNKLTSLEGAPIEVGGNFGCWDNNLTSLQGAPRKVGGHFDCSFNKFTSEPDHSFIKIGGEFMMEKEEE